jgi:hypothetical protein
VYRDRQFIRDARLSMTEIGLWADQYESGDMSASEVAGAAQRAASSIGGSARQTPRSSGRAG